jgi:uncharacterized protein DUF4384
MFTTVGLLSLLAVAGRETTPPRASFYYRPRVEVWTNRGDDAYSGGQAVRVSFRTEQDAYVTILRVDTDGRVRVLFPREPWDDNFARGGRDYEVSGGSSRDAFSIDDYPGVGYIFAVAAADPFIYDAIESSDHWDYRVIADGRVRGDPYVALTDLAQRIVPDGYAHWDYDIVPYYVERRYDYPRFLCYDCHTYVSYPYWSPYDHTCDRFRIVVFDDPYYYPYRNFGGTRAVFPRPLRPGPRFIFKDRAGLETFISRVKQRPVNDDRRREVGVRGRDLGGTGVIPPPTIKPRRPDERADDRQPVVSDDRSRDDGRGRRTADRPEQPTGPDRPGQAGRPPQFRPERVRPDAQAPAPPPAPPPSPQPERPRAEPRREPDARPRVETPPRPQSEPRAEPRREPEARPRVEEPRAEPKQEAPRDKPTAEPELKRRKP